MEKRGALHHYLYLLLCRACTYWSKYSENWEQHKSYKWNRRKRRASGQRIQKKNGISSNTQRENTNKTKHGTPQIRIKQLTQKNKKNARGKPAWYKEQTTDKSGIKGEKHKIKQKAHIQNPQERNRKINSHSRPNHLQRRQKEFRYLRCKRMIKNKRRDEKKKPPARRWKQQQQQQQIARAREQKRRREEHNKRKLIWEERRSGGGQGSNRSD